MQTVRTQLHIFTTTNKHNRARTKSRSSSGKRESKAIHSTPTFPRLRLCRSSWLTGRKTQKHMHRATLEHQQPQIRLSLTIRPNSRRRPLSSSSKSQASCPRCSTPPMTNERNLDEQSRRALTITNFWMCGPPAKMPTKEIAKQVVHRLNISSRVHIQQQRGRHRRLIKARLLEMLPMMKVRLPSLRCMLTDLCLAWAVMKVSSMSCFFNHLTRGRRQRTWAWMIWW